MEKLIQIITEIFMTTKISEMNGLQLVILVLLSLGVLWVAKKAIFLIWIAIKTIFSKLFHLLSAKEACQKIQCTTCGRTLDNCVCEKNRHRSYISRLAHYRKERRQERKK